jgi:hypothetical protein
MPPIASPAIGRYLISLVVGLIPTPDEFEVQLVDNGVRVGRPDASTNDALLRLRVGEADAYVVFGIAWDRIAEIRTKEEVWKPDQFAALRQELADRSRANRFDSGEFEPEIPSHRDRASSRPLWQAPEHPGPSEPDSARVQFIDMDVVAANWDADPEWDGLVLRIWPMDQRGRVVRAAGTLTVSVTGENYHAFGDKIERLGHWVRSVRPADYGLDGVSVRLRFQNYEPERWDAAGHPDHGIASSGEVHVSFAVPGHGVFHATTATPVRLRRFSPQRDRLFLRTGTRSLSVQP